MPAGTMLKNKAFAALISFICLFYGCAGLKGADAVKDIREARAGHYIEGVPFFPQDELMCGPAALAGVIGFYGRGEGMAAVAQSVYREKLRGTLPIDLVIYAKEKGFEALFYKGSMEDLRDKVSRDAPLIIFLNLGYDFYPVGHYIVVTGYNEKARAVVANSGMEKDKAYSYDYINDAWAKTGYSTLLIRPGGKPL